DTRSGIDATMTKGTAPTAFIMSGPAEGSTTSATSATFSFGADSPAGEFRCRLDAGEEFHWCDATETVTDLTDGQHTEYVGPITAAGHESVVAHRTWTVDSTATSSPRTSSGTTPPTGGT